MHDAILHLLTLVWVVPYHDFPLVSYKRQIIVINLFNTGWNEDLIAY
jgi:hypothetical protein